MVVVECKGHVTKKRSRRYDNGYYFVFEFGTEGKLLALPECMDTALAERVLEPLSPAAWIEALTLRVRADEKSTYGQLRPIQM